MLIKTIHHNMLAGYEANEHIDWTNTNANLLTSGIITVSGSTRNLSGIIEVFADTNDFDDYDGVAGSCAFLSELAVGDTVNLGGESKTIATIVDDHTATITGTWTDSHYGTATVNIADSTLDNGLLSLGAGRMTGLRYTGDGDTGLRRAGPNIQELICGGEATVTFSTDEVRVKTAGTVNEGLVLEATAGGSGFMLTGGNADTWKFKAVDGGGFKIRDHSASADRYLIDADGHHDFKSGNITTLGTVDATGLFNTNGDLPLNAGAQGDIVLFGTTDVDNAANGKKLIVHRKAAEFDRQFELYINSLGSAIFEANANMLFNAPSSSIYFRAQAGGAINFADNVATNITLGKGGGYTRIGSAASYTNISNLGHIALPAGTANAAPLKFTAGPLLENPEAGSIEFYDNRFYITNIRHQRAIDRTSDVAVETVTCDGAAKPGGNSTDEVTLWTGVMEANSLVAGNMFTFHADGVVDSASNGDLVTLRVKVNDVTKATLQQDTKKMVGAHWHIDANATQRTINNGGNGSRAIHIHLEIDELNSHVLGVVEIDTTASMDVTLTAQWNNEDAGNVLSLYQGYMGYKN